MVNEESEAVRMDKLTANAYAGWSCRVVSAV